MPVLLLHQRCGDRRVQWAGGDKDSLRRQHFSLTWRGCPLPCCCRLPAFSLGLNGVWWALTIASIIKGTLVTCWYSLYVRRKKLYAPAAE